MQSRECCGREYNSVGSYRAFRREGHAQIPGIEHEYREHLAHCLR